MIDRLIGVPFFDERLSGIFAQKQNSAFSYNLISIHDNLRFIAGHLIDAARLGLSPNFTHLNEPINSSAFLELINDHIHEFETEFLNTFQEKVMDFARDNKEEYRKYSPREYLSLKNFSYTNNNLSELLEQVSKY